MPSTPRSSDQRTTLPWFLDALRWSAGLSPAGDRDVIGLVRLDLDDDLRDLLAEGTPRGQAHRALWRRVRLECGFFWPRAGRWWKARMRACAARVSGRCRRVGRRAVKPVLGVGLVGALLLSAQWLWFDRATLREWGGAATRLAEMRQEFEDASGRLGQAQGQNLDHGIDAPLSAEAQGLLARMDRVRQSFLQTRRDHPDEFFLLGMVGLVDEELAEFWEARGDEEKAASHWRAAVESYSQGADEGDPLALLHFGVWNLERTGPRDAIGYLRRAHARWHLLGIPREHDPGHAAAKFYLGLVELWKAEHDPVVALEARPLEQQALRDLRGGAPQYWTHELLYNAACLRALMVAAGVLEPMEGLKAVELLHSALDATEEFREQLARGVLSDPDLAVLRDSSAYDGIASRANSILQRALEQKKE